MEQEKILSLILSKLDNIEKEQQEMRKEQQEMKNDIFKRLDSLEEGQKSIQQYIINTDDSFKKYDETHRFVEKLKKVVGE